MKKTIVVLALAALTSPLFAQVTVKQVNDRRTSGKFFNHLEISLELTKVKASEITASRVLVATAVDSTGVSLVDTEASEPDLQANHGMGMSDRDAAALASVSVILKNPARKATSVKEVRGEIELYMPGKDPNSTAEIPKFLSFSGKPLTHKALKANGVEISILSPAQIDAERKRIGDAKRKELSAAGYSGEDLESMVKSELEYTLNLDEGELLMRIKDPNKRIQSMVFVAGTEEKHISTSDTQGFTKLSTWGEKPDPSWGLRISMKTSKNLVRQAFALKDVALP